MKMFNYFFGDYYFCGKCNIGEYGHEIEARKGKLDWVFSNLRMGNLCSYCIDSYIVASWIQVVVINDELGNC